MGDVEKSPEMSPQEDGTKVPLSNDGLTVSMEEAKFVPNPNGDAKVDVGVASTFSGLTKEELMKYSTDPFWVRLRWFLFVLFWLGWLAMLVVSVVIIIQAPGCEPPPVLLWVEEQPIMEISPEDLPTEEVLMASSKQMGVSSIYFPALISRANFQEMSYKAEELIKAIFGANMDVVTDMPLSVDMNNPFYANATSERLIAGNDNQWNYSNPELPTPLFNEITGWWSGEGVKGFLMEKVLHPNQTGFGDNINVLMKEDESALGLGSFAETKNRIATSEDLQNFIENNSMDWSYFKFNPWVADPGVVQNVSIAQQQNRLTTMGLFLVPGTPVIPFNSDPDNSTSELIGYLTSMRGLNGIKFGDLTFVNATQDVVAFTRVYKGSPAYAIALNFNAGHANVTFADTPNVGTNGKAKLVTAFKGMNVYESKEKYQLNNVPLAPYEGKVLEFVAAF